MTEEHISDSTGMASAESYLIINIYNNIFYMLEITHQYNWRKDTEI